MRAQIPAAAPPGTYDVQVERGGQRATLQAGLRIVADTLRVIFIDVGQGDATLVVSPEGRSLLFDGGKREQVGAVQAALDAEGIDVPDIVVLSHYDVDHLGGLVEYLAGDDRQPGTNDDIIPDVLLAPGGVGTCDSLACAEFAALAKTPRVPTVGEALDLGSVTATVVAVDGDIGDGIARPGIDDNGVCVVIELEYGGRSIMLLADITGGGLGTVDLETPLAQRWGPVDVLRVSHHGSATSSPASAVDAWAPRFAIFSVGTDNAFCHPDSLVLSRWRASGATLYGTGHGIVDAIDRCDPTSDPDGALGRGTITLTVQVDGAIDFDFDDG